MELLQETLRQESPALRRQMIDVLDGLTRTYTDNFRAELAKNKSKLENARNPQEQALIYNEIEAQAAKKTLKDLEQTVRERWEGTGPGRRRLSEAEEGRLQALLGVFRCKCFAPSRRSAAGACRIGPASGGGPGGTHGRFR